MKGKNGGARPGSGQPKKEPTKVIRVPISKLDQINKIMNQRKDGYYWVRFTGVWQPAEFSNYDGGSCWSLTGTDHEFQDDELDVIGSQIKHNAGN